MGATDGHVVGTTAIVDHGAAADRWNLVILAEGFQEAELPQFHTAAAAFAEKLFTTPPFDELWCAVNVWRVDVASTDSGADDPACSDGTPAAGTTAATFFDATFCFNNLGRLLFGNETLALQTAAAAVPEVDATVIIVNSTKYGGAGGGAAWFSLDPQASEIGVHELGHSAFRLQDEYADANNQWTDPEPLEPANVTTITDRATTKWAHLIDAATPLPTQSNPDCSTENTAASPVPVGTVGLFEGGARARCGIYRPEHNCRMRTLGQPFCAVCKERIRAVLRPFMPRTLAPTTGVQFAGSVPGGGSKQWFTHSWPACWHVTWNVAPTSLSQPGPDIRWDIQVQRASQEHVTYWINVTNLESAPVEIEARYAILAK
jgi:hypothetical protein